MPKRSKERPLTAYEHELVSMAGTKLGFGPEDFWRIVRAERCRLSSSDLTIDEYQRERNEAMRASGTNGRGSKD
jgi:hypothetical protein